MGMIRTAFVLGLAALAAPAAAQLDDPVAREARWAEVRAAIFGDKPVTATTGVITLDAPVRADDAALVPVTLTLHDPAIVAVHLVIDENPSPYAAHLVFGPAADRHAVTFRVRVNGYTNMHAIAEYADGRLVTTTRFVKAAGGCSAPIGVTDEDAMQGMGEMRARFDRAAKGQPIPAVVMVRHPNFTGMQMNQITRLTTPARYVERIEVKSGERSVFTLDGDIALSANPAIGFAFAPRTGEILHVTATDSAKARWEHSFAITQTP
ncbi:MAG TPA: quinoprotein dehydrogenase-associated SoxYZ-like carrier [Sphingomonas sp.]|nr:quinoprotein dehydrogenase-associated SoxYZ-like carrier [Sphingomonas sp.]